VFVLYAAVGHKPDTELTDFDLSSGNGYYFTGGNYTPVTWSKDGDEAPLKVTGADGKELAVAPGKSYIAVVSNTQEATLAIDGVSPAAPTATQTPGA